MNSVIAELDAMFEQEFAESRYENRFCERHNQPYQVAIVGGFEIDDVLGCGCQYCNAEHEASRIEQQRLAAIKPPAIPSRYRERGFTDFRVDNEKQKHYLQRCQRFVDNFPTILKRGNSLVLCGNSGTGKTHLACAIAKGIFAQKKQVIYTTAAEMLGAIKATYARGSLQTPEQVINRFARADLLIVDEVGRNAGSLTEDNLFFQIIDQRYNRPAPTVIVSNLSSTELQGFLGIPTMDRLADGGVVLSFDWESYREKDHAR